MRLFVFVVIFFAFVTDVLAQTPDETPATPRWKGAPDYPTACLSEQIAATEDERVDVAFTINAAGLTEDVRIMRSTNECFEEAALSAVRSWIYAPRQVQGRSLPQEDMEATFIFEFQTAQPNDNVGEPEIETKSRALVFDARPIERIPPEYPARCRPKAYSEEYVVLQFDVTVEGRTKNFQVIESTNDCFNESALESVKGWRYEPKTIDGVLTDRVGVISLVIFRLQYGRPRPEDAVRPMIQRRLGRVRRLLERNRVDDAMARLEDFERKYGDSLSPAELAEFHRMRGMVRIGAKDYTGALDDLRAARRISPHDPEGALQNLIEQLEAALEAPPVEPQAQEAPAEQAPSSD